MTATDLAVPAPRALPRATPGAWLAAALVFGFLLLFLSSLLVWAGLKLTGQRFGAVMKS